MLCFPDGSACKQSACNVGDTGDTSSSLVGKIPLEKEMAIHSSILVWRIPWTEEPGRLQSTGLSRVGHDWATSLSLLCISYERQYPSLSYNLWFFLSSHGNAPIKAIRAFHLYHQNFDCFHERCENVSMVVGRIWELRQLKYVIRLILD